MLSFTKQHLTPGSHAPRSVARRPCPARRAAGFTIVELMVVVTVVAILSAIAVPAMRTFFQNDSQWTQSSSLVMALNSARNEAIKADVASGISVCPSTDGVNCNSAAWSQGWIVQSSAPGTIPTILISPALPSGTTLSEASGATIVTFLSTGMVQAPAAFTMCDNRGPTQARFTQVSVSGSVTSALGHKMDGTALACP